MKVLFLDGETTVKKLGDKTDNSPKNPDNKGVAFYWAKSDLFGLTVEKSVFYHEEYPVPDSRDALQDALDWADVMVCHNAKFDAFWLTEMGFRLPERLYCTMVAEYVLARGQRTELSLKATAERRNVTRKKSDLVDELFKSGVGFEKMPLATVHEYAEADVIACAEIYYQQQDELEAEELKPLRTVIELMMDMMEFLLEIEGNGIKIDLGALNQVGDNYQREKDQLEKRLSEIVEEVMGDTPINLNSGADMSKVVYSRQVIDREKHREMWNIGVDARGKPLRPPRLNTSQFSRYVRETTQKVYRTVAHHCIECDGHGKIRKIKKDGTPFKQMSKCPVCHGEGALYVPTGRVAGLKLNPTTAADASINGFKTDKVTIKKLIQQAKFKDNLIAVEFLEKTSRLNAISTYLDSFVKGIRTWTRPSGYLHSSFNQTVTATGRLSSTNPNFQNLPKGNKFEVRRAIVSRFPGGSVGEWDFSGLEFRVAGELSRDPQIIEDILNGKDVHSQTASIIHQIPPEQVTKDQRSAAKSVTFSPLYGGMGAGEPEHVQSYFKEYFNVYKGLKAWHNELADQVLKRGFIQTPSGRQFAFPGAKRLRSGRVTNHTQVVNFPVQSFATADQVPLACIRALRRFRELKLQSKLILTVHDSIVVDIYPGELNAVNDALTWAMTGVTDEMKDRFNYEAVLPLDIEGSVGPNWMEQTELSVDSRT
jgi:DNA polymerase I-like protein with 3'-5' exonuclease and polymerase domains